MTASRQGPKGTWLCILLSSLLPGLGQLYNSQLKAALLWFLGFAAALGVGAYEMLSRSGDPKWAWELLGIALAIYFSNIVHVFRSVHGKEQLINLPAKASDADPYLTIFLNQWIPGLGHVYLRQKLIGILLLGAFTVGVASGLDWVFSWVRILLSVAAMAHALWYTTKSSRRARAIGGAYIVAYACIFLSLAYLKDLQYVWVARHENNWNEPTIHRGDFTLQIAPRLMSVRQGDLIAYQMPNPSDNKPFTFSGRAVAFAKDTVLISQGILYVNGIHVSFGDVQYATGEGSQYAARGPYVVGTDSVFVLGDNSEVSLDSRHFGAIPRPSVRGVCSKILWPYDRVGRLQ
jgi:signal peptidase I